MKKNLISILILALLVANLIMTAIMMFSVLNASGKTAKLVGKIAEAVDLELEAEPASEEEEAVSIKDTDVYVISESMTIPLAPTEGDSKDHYFIVTVSLSLNMKNADYSTYGSAESMQSKESLIKSEINAVVGKYTLEYVKNNQEAIRQEILERLQALYDSKFIFGVTFSDPLYS